MSPAPRRLPLDITTSLEVLEPAFVTVLDDRFQVALQRWPGLAASVLERALERAQEGWWPRRSHSCRASKTVCWRCSAGSPSAGAASGRTA